MTFADFFPLILGAVTFAVVYGSLRFRNWLARRTAAKRNASPMYLESFRGFDRPEPDDRPIFRPRVCPPTVRLCDLPPVKKAPSALPPGYFTPDPEFKGVWQRPPVSESETGKD